MRKNVLISLLLILLGAPLFFSCAISPDITVVPPIVPSNVPVRPENPPPESDISAVTERTAPAQPVPPASEMILNPNLNRPLLGRGQTDAEKLAAFLLMVNSSADPKFVKQLSRLYVEEAALEGIDHDVAFAQMCLETGFLRYGGLVTFDMNNFCGLGSTGPGIPGERFPTPQMGVRAQIQHLKGYATEEPPSQELVDPRYKYVRYGSAPTIKGLAGTWAADRGYAEKIADVLVRLYAAGSTAADSNPADSDTDDDAVIATESPPEE